MLERPGELSGVFLGALRKVTAAIVGVEGVQIDDVHHAIDVHSAKVRLTEQRYDLLVLDIALPLRVAVANGSKRATRGRDCAPRRADGAP